MPSATCGGRPRGKIEFARSLMKTDRFFDVVRMGDDLIDGGRIYLADFDSPIDRVDEETYELLAEQSQLGAQAVDAEVHMVVGIAPEGIEDLLHASHAGYDAEPVSEHHRSHDFDGLAG